MAASALVLFDIDGTLVRRAGPHHRLALEAAVRAVTGIAATTEGVPVHGMLDQDILAEMMSNAGLSAGQIRAALPAVFEHAQALYEREVPSLRGKTCPGVRRFLARLSRRRVPMALVTGNLTRIGWKKIERAGLRRYFRFGAFSEMAATRAELARMAAAEALRQGLIAPSANISLIGDAPSDIVAAKTNGFRSVSVHTGVSSREELASHTPDLLVPALEAVPLDLIAR